uniref:Uncharacterized protein n=1 Tax=Utricularia reniformis TaxID=192314 RepID=A0A1Y0AZQ2_9LAMI|nr:hypothetical protein AEK19_MT0392 [Utricularia reniformis]ART30662.1 hypothetical protein AEK19_MT0392 [Utricularia reniformis]
MICFLLSNLSLYHLLEFVNHLSGAMRTAMWLGFGPTLVLPVFQYSLELFYRRRRLKGELNLTELTISRVDFLNVTHEYHPLGVDQRVVNGSGISK